MTLWESLVGWFSAEGNETTTGAKNFDPAKSRLATPISSTDGGGGGVWSANRARNPGQVCEGGQQEEMGFMRIEQSESVRGSDSNLRAEFNLFLNDGSGAGDSAMVRAFALECDRITKMHPALLESLRIWLLLPNGGPEAAAPNKLVSPDGRVELDIQNADALNMTLYLDGVALWSVLTGTTPAGKAKGLR